MHKVLVNSAKERVWEQFVLYRPDIKYSIVMLWHPIGSRMGNIKNYLRDQINENIQ